MSKNEKLSQAINSWSSGQCRESIADFSYLFEDSVLDSVKEGINKTVESIAQDMGILDKFMADCFFTQVIGYEFPFHHYPDANQDFLEDLVLYLKGEISELNYEDYI